MFNSDMRREFAQSALSHFKVQSCKTPMDPEAFELLWQVNEAFEGVDVELRVDGSGAGRGREGQKDVLPPLMPGMKARQQAKQS